MNDDSDRVAPAQAQDPEGFPATVDNTYRNEFSHFAEGALFRGLGLRPMRPAVWVERHRELGQPVEYSEGIRGLMPSRTTLSVRMCIPK